MPHFPGTDEAAPYYFTYINRIPGDDALAILETQVDEILSLGITEEKSLHRYAPEKWSIREVLNHINDTERIFTFRALWFARGFDAPIPGFDQEIAVAGAQANDISWERLLEDLRAVRQSTLTLYRNLPAEAWSRSGMASGYSFTVNALAHIAAGHVEHHLAVLRERYL